MHLLTASNGIALGTQVTGKVGTGGVMVTVVTDDYGRGTTQIDVQSTSGIPTKHGGRQR